MTQRPRPTTVFAIAARLAPDELRIIEAYRRATASSRPVMITVYVTGNTSQIWEGQPRGVDRRRPGR